MPGRPFLQIPGPTLVPERIVRAMSQPVIDHRKQMVDQDKFPGYAPRPVRRPQPVQHHVGVVGDGVAVQAGRRTGGRRVRGAAFPRRQLRAR